MPLNNFYTFTIASHSNNELTAEITIEPAHEIFKGHFPEQPVTPGVALIEIARSVLSQYLNKELMLQSAREIKFMTPVIPSENKIVELKISFEEKEEEYKTSCLFFAEEKTFTKLKGVFRAS